eukprot:m.114837 g.114837  ORF g.114837 m.114837 type:complete len:85 (-) comp28375_c1_seq2:316-570(-)
MSLCQQLPSEVNLLLRLRTAVDIMQRYANSQPGEKLCLTSSHNNTSTITITITTTNTATDHSTACMHSLPPTMSLTSAIPALPC